MLVAILSFAQMPQLPQFPVDKAYKIGKLDNGMTYYIRHNDKPAQRAEFYLATHVGAVQEAPDQDGLAHFLEHMCFNGTKNFPGKALLDYLQSIGASFGGNINAATGFESTQYMLNNIPLLREGVIDTCLLIMHDYSHFVTCDPAEIDAERGVIIEEKRSRNTADWRVLMEEKKYLYKGSALAETSLIGSQENLETFKPESLVNFYQTWYRPDNQALIVVGDIDVDQIEQKIKTIFAHIPAPVNPKQKEPLVIDENKEPLVGIITDPELTATEVSMYWRSEALPVQYNNTVLGLSQQLLESIFGMAMNERLSEIEARPDSPFLGAGFGIDNICESTSAVYGSATAREGDAINALTVLYTEIERMSRYGFTDAEYERAKTKLTTSVENAANRADSRKNAEFINGAISNFNNNTILMDPADFAQIVKQVLPSLKSSDLNKALKQLITEENLVILYTAPQKEGLTHPTEADLLAVVENVRKADIAAPEAEEALGELLNAKKVKGGKYVASKEGIHGSKEYMLSNGVKVVLLPTEFEKDRISVELTMEGGQSLIPESEIASFEQNIWSLFVGNSGVSKFSATQLSKMLAGKTVSASPFIGALSHGVSAGSNRKDFETALQLLYLYVKDPRFDIDEYNQGVNSLKQMLPNMLTNSNYVLQQQLMETIFSGNVRRKVLDEDILAAANLKTIEKNYKKLFKGVKGATLYVVGDFDEAEVKPLIAKYVGALPKGKQTAWVDPNCDIVDGKVENRFSTKMEAPMVTVFQCYKSNAAYSVQQEVTANALSYILDMVYTKTLREEEGGTYGASSAAVWNRIPKQYGIMQVAFQTNVEQAPKLSELAIEGLRGLATDGPTAEQFDMAQKNALKGIPEKRINNGYWETVLTVYNKYGEDYDAQYEAAVNALSPEMIKALAAEFLNSGNFVQIVMSPAE